MAYNSTIRNKPPEGKQCFHVTCGNTCRRPKPEKKPRKPIPKVSAKRKAGFFDLKATENDHNETEVPQNGRKPSSAAQWRWFEERRKEMTGICAHCSGRTSKNNDDYFHFSICHIMPKNHFPSVATNEFNFIELCAFGNNCHGNMDNKTLDLTDMNCWSTIVERFCIMYPSIAPKERRRIPQVLLQYVETE